MASEPVARALAEEVVRWGSMKQTGVSLRYMMEFGSRPTPRNLLISAQFLQRELPIRIARRALELDSLPFGLSNKPAILKVRPYGVDASCPAPRFSLSLSLSLSLQTIQRCFI
jgi:pyruvate dehydrogenase kinase 2/3/4